MHFRRFLLSGDKNCPVLAGNSSGNWRGIRLSSRERTTELVFRLVNEEKSALHDSKTRLTTVKLLLVNFCLGIQKEKDGRFPK